jgi:hypothetical protein
MKIEDTIGKRVYFIDRNGAFRINKIVALHGNTITTQDATGGKERIHPETSKIHGIIMYTKDNCAVLEPIEYKETRIGKKLKNKKIKKEIEATMVKPLRTKRPRAGRPRRK